jgi:hypothetical protein
MKVKKIQNTIPAKMMQIGGITNILFSPLFAIFYEWTEPLESRIAPKDPIWLWSFYFCTTVFGFLYYKVSRNPLKYASLIPVTILAKTWGILVIVYATIVGYKYPPLAGLYDLIFLPFFIALYFKAKNLHE